MPVGASAHRCSEFHAQVVILCCELEINTHLCRSCFGQSTLNVPLSALATPFWKQQRAKQGITSRDIIQRSLSVDMRRCLQSLSDGALPGLIGQGSWFEGNLFGLNQKLSATLELAQVTIRFRHRWPWCVTQITLLIS